MALSDQLTELAKRAKQLEDHAAAAKQKNKADLERDVKDARESAQSRAEALHTKTATAKGQVSAWWENVGRSWNDHVATVRQNIDDRRAAHDLASAQRAADQADDDAAYAIDYAFAAIDEAEYAVLDAQLAHFDVDELANN
jgi:hypothetical protein